MTRIDLLWKAYEEAAANTTWAIKNHDEELKAIFRAEKEKLWALINEETER